MLQQDKFISEHICLAGFAAVNLSSGAFESEVPLTVCGHHYDGKGTAWHSQSVLINVWSNV